MSEKPGSIYTLDHISQRIDKISETYIKAEEIKQHYATKFFCGSIMAGFFIALCSAYWLVTPVLIDSKNSKLNENVEKLLEIVKSSKQQ